VEKFDIETEEGDFTKARLLLREILKDTSYIHKDFLKKTFYKYCNEKKYVGCYIPKPQLQKLLKEFDVDGVYKIKK
jgi:DNA polymerase III delta prime subunit